MACSWHPPPCPLHRCSKYRAKGSPHMLIPLLPSSLANYAGTDLLLCHGALGQAQGSYGLASGCPHDAPALERQPPERCCWFQAPATPRLVSAGQPLPEPDLSIHLLPTHLHLAKIPPSCCDSCWKHLLPPKPVSPLFLSQCLVLPFTNHPNPRSGNLL